MPTFWRYPPQGQKSSHAKQYLMLVIICVKYEKSLSRIADVIEYIWQGEQYFYCICYQVLAECRPMSKDITRNTHCHGSDHLWQIWKELIQKMLICRVDMIRCVIWKQVYCKVMTKCFWRYKSWSKAIHYMQHIRGFHASIFCAKYKKNVTFQQL